jgi:hypothetical protein
MTTIARQGTLFGDPPRSVNKVREKVKHILANHPAARGDDKLLIWLVWTLCDGGEEVFRSGDLERIKRWLLSDAASTPETIRRTRQDIQKHGEYLPPEPVYQARHEKAEEYRCFFGKDGEEPYG